MVADRDQSNQANLNNQGCKMSNRPQKHTYIFEEDDMISTKTLKTFVKMHEYKLNAKINGLKASRLDSELHSPAEHNTLEAAEHWNLQETDNASRRRPKSHYFDFILTA
jgi:hypothetical protein